MPTQQATTTKIRNGQRQLAAVDPGLMQLLKHGYQRLASFVELDSPAAELSAARDGTKKPWTCGGSRDLLQHIRARFDQHAVDGAENVSEGGRVLDEICARRDWIPPLTKFINQIAVEEPNSPAIASVS
jgi:hypothetical protein